MWYLPCKLKMECIVLCPTTFNNCRFSFLLGAPLPSHHQSTMLNPKHPIQRAKQIHQMLRAGSFDIPI